MRHPGRTITVRPVFSRYTGIFMEVILILAVYAFIVNLIAFCMMGIDKRKARRKAFRIPEATLFVMALIGGSIGSIAGMYLFRHKTHHLKFSLGLPLILAVQIVFLLYLK